MRSACGVFGSRSITVHLLKGLGAALLIIWLIENGADHPLRAVGALLAAVILMKGCPMCWTMGLVETIAARAKLSLP